MVRADSEASVPSVRAGRGKKSKERRSDKHQLDELSSSVQFMSTKQVRMFSKIRTHDANCKHYRALVS